MRLRLVLLSSLLHLLVFSIEAPSNYSSSDVIFSIYSTSIEPTTGIENSTTMATTELTSEVTTTDSSVLLNSTLNSSNLIKEQEFGAKSSNVAPSLERLSDFVPKDSKTYLRTASKKLTIAPVGYETTTSTFTTNGKYANSKNSGETGKEALDEKKESERSMVRWIFVGTTVAVGVIIIGVAVLVACLKRRKSKNQSKESGAKVATPIRGTPLKTERTQKSSVPEVRSLKEDETQPSPKLEKSDSKSSVILNGTPDKETKKEQKESNTEITKGKEKESITNTTLPVALLKRKSTVEYWKEDSRKSLEAFKPTTDVMDDATFGFSDGSKGGVKLLKVDGEDEKVFVETKEMVAQIAEARAALDRKKPRTEITQSSKHKKIAATLRTKQE